MSTTKKTTVKMICLHVDKYGENSQLSQCESRFYIGDLSSTNKNHVWRRISFLGVIVMRTPQKTN